FARGSPSWNRRESPVADAAPQLRRLRSGGRFGISNAGDDPPADYLGVALQLRPLHGDDQRLLGGLTVGQLHVGRDRDVLRHELAVVFRQIDWMPRIFDAHLSDRGLARKAPFGVEYALGHLRA